MDDSALAARTERVRQRMGELEVDVLLLSLGADLPWLTGYQAMPLERLTMLVLPVDGEATLVVPRLEAPRVEPHPDLFGILAWEESEDPVALVADLAGRPPPAHRRLRPHVGHVRPPPPGRPARAAGGSRRRRSPHPCGR